MRRPLLQKIAIGSLLAAWVIFGICFCVPISRATAFDAQKAEEIVWLIRSQVLIPNAQGLVVLPSRYQSASVNGKAYVSRGESGELLVFLPSRIGREQLFESPINDDRYMQGYLFTEITELPCYNADSICWWNIQAPTYTEPWNARKNNRVQRESLAGVGKISEHWYEIQIMS